MKLLFKYLFGEVTSPVDVMSPGIHTTKPPTHISFSDWCCEFKVSMLNGRNITELN